MFGIHLTPALEELFPGLRADLIFTHGVACELDEDIPERDFRVFCRVAPPNAHLDYVAGGAWASAATIRYGRRVEHPNGRITLRIGTVAEYPTIVRIFAHELRHLAQAARGRKQFGYMTYKHMGEALEPDALMFESKVLEAMMLDDEYPWRAEGRQFEDSRPWQVAPREVVVC